MTKDLSTTTNRTMSSLEISSLTGKTHAIVVNDIKRVLEEAEIDSAVFQTIYKDSMNRNKPCFNLPFRETNLVISGYSVKHRLAIIDRWQELETAQPKIPTTFAEALRLAADTQEALEAATLQIEQDKPKVDFALAVRRLDGSCSVGEFAKVIGTGQNKLYRQLREDGFLRINNQPYQSVIDRGLFVVIEQTPYTDSNGKTYPSFKTCITGKGQVVLERKYRKVA